MNVPEVVEEMSHELNLYVVGGAVRDHLMGTEPVDFDLVVEGQEEDYVVGVLSQWGDVEQVIGNAPVYMVKTVGGSLR